MLAGGAERTIAVKIHGMDCAEEVSFLKREVGPVVGGDERLSFNLLTGCVTVRVADGSLPPGAIQDAVSRAGLVAEPWSDDERPLEDAAQRIRRGRFIATTASGVATALALLVGCADSRLEKRPLTKGTMKQPSLNWSPWPSRDTPRRLRSGIGVVAQGR